MSRTQCVCFRIRDAGLVIHFCRSGNWCELMTSRGLFSFFQHENRPYWPINEMAHGIGVHVVNYRFRPSHKVRTHTCKIIEELVVLTTITFSEELWEDICCASLVFARTRLRRVTKTILSVQFNLYQVSIVVPTLNRYAVAS